MWLYRLVWYGLIECAVQHRDAVEGATLRCVLSRVVSAGVGDPKLWR